MTRKALWLREVARRRDVRNTRFQNEGPHDGIVSPREEVSVIVVLYILRSSLLLILAPRQHFTFVGYGLDVVLVEMGRLKQGSLEG